MSDISREAIDKLLAGVTAGPWKVKWENVDPDWAIVMTSGGSIVANVNGADEANGLFIAASRTLVPALRDALDEAEAEVARLSAEVARLLALDDAEKMDAYQSLMLDFTAAKAEVARLGREVNTARYGQPDFAWSIHLEAMADLRSEVARLTEQIGQASVRAEEAEDRAEAAKETKR